MNRGVCSDGYWTRVRLLGAPRIDRIVFALLIVLIGVAIACLPLTWAAVLLVGTCAVLLIFARPVFGLYLLIFAIPFGSLKETSVGVMRVGGAEAIAALTIAAWVACMIARRKIKTLHPPLLLPMALFLGVASFSVLGALSLQWSLKGLLVWLELVAVYLFVVNVVDVRDVKILLVLTLVAGTAEALLGFYQFFAGKGPEGFLLFDRFVRAYGTFEQPNPYGGYLALILPVALSLFLAPWHRRRWWPLCIWTLAGLSLCLMGAALVMSWSRGAMLGFLAAVVLVALAGFWHRAFSPVTCGALLGVGGGALAALWFCAPSGGLFLAPVLGGLAGLGVGWGISSALLRRQAWLALGLISALGVLFMLVGGDRLLPAVVGQRFSDFLPYLRVTDVRAEHVTDENYAVIERLAHWYAALEMLRERPLLGVGIGNYVPLYPAYRVPGWEDPMGHAHNCYLHIAAETGLLGLAGYSLFLVAAFREAWAALGRTTGPRRAMVLGILGVLGAFAVHSLFDNLYVHGMNMHLAVLLGLLYVLTERCEVGIAEAS